MSNNLELIFEECLERVFQGESIESCSTSYPNEAAYLEPLLRTAIGVSNRAAKLRPDPEFKARASMRIQAAWQYAAQQKPVAKPSRGFAWQRSLAFALTAVVVLVCSSVGTAFASSNALPDEPLYPAKLATEQIAMAFSFSEENKAALHAQLAEKRAQEIAAMARAGKTDYVVATATRLTHQIEQAEFSVTALAQKEAAQRASVSITPQPTRPAPAMKAPPPAPSQEAATSSVPQPGGEKATPPPAADVAAARFRKAERARELVSNSTAKNIAVLEEVLEQAPPAAKPALNQVINRAREMQQRTLPPRGIDGKPQSQDGKPPQVPPGITPDKPRPTSDESEPLPPKHPVKPLKPRETPKPPLPVDTPKPPPVPIRPSDTTNTQPGILPTPVVPPSTGTSKPPTRGITQPSGTTTQPGGSSGPVSPSGTSSGNR
jgi:hypothetical protein